MPDPPRQMLEKDRLRGLVPASAEGKKDEVYGAYLERLGIETSASIHEVLASSNDLRFKRFLELMSSPGRTIKIQTIAKQCGIDLAEFQEWFRKAATQIAIAEAQLKSAGIVSDMARDAMTKDEFCERCDGLGWVAANDKMPVDTPGYRLLMMQTTRVKNGEGQMEDREEPVFCRTCPRCKGTTTVRVVGDEHARDRVLEIAGLTTKGKAAVQIVQNFGGAAHTSAVTGALSALTIDVELDSDEGEVAE